MTNKTERAKSQLKADQNYEKKRAENTARFGGRCTLAEKDFIKRVLEKSGVKTEKELFFLALKEFDKKINK